MINEKGFTLIEVMIAATVLSLGILAAAAMQINAIGSNTSAISRSNANAVALSFMEELQRVPFDDDALVDLDGGIAAPLANGSLGLDDGEALTPGIFPDLTVTPADQSILTANFLNNFPGLTNTYRIVGAGNNTRLVDEANREYLLFYNVDMDPWGDGTDSFCYIRLFVYWQSPLGGVNHIEYSTTKYNNTTS